METILLIKNATSCGVIAIKRRNILDWKKIDGSVNYSISNTGLVRNDITNKILKPSMNKYGYYRLGYTDSAKQYIYQTIHRLVALHYVLGRTKDRFCVNHKDGCKTNNDYTNLEWVTVKENNRHAVVTGLSKAPLPLSVYDLSNDNVVEYASIKDLSRAFSISANILIPRMRKSYLYPFMNRYIITVRDYNTINTETHGITIHAYDVINKQHHTYGSTGMCAYMLCVRAICFRHSPVIRRNGYIISREPVTDIRSYSYTRADRDRYLGSNYKPRSTQWLSYDFKTCTEISHDTVSELFNYISSKYTGSVDTLTIRHIVNRLTPGKLTKPYGMFLGFGIAKCSNETVINWGHCTQEVYYNSYNNTLFRQRTYRVTTSTTVTVVVGIHKLLKHLKSVLRSFIFDIPCGNITQEIITNALTDSTISVVRLNKIKI